MRNQRRELLDFIQTFCKHTKGELAGQPFVLEPWQIEIIEAIFGWKSKKTKLRKFRQCFIFIPRKNGKTTMMVGIALYMLFSDGEKGAEIVSAAADKEQARLSFSIAKNMVLQEPNLSKEQVLIVIQLLMIKLDRTTKLFRLMQIPSTD